MTYFYDTSALLNLQEKAFEEPFFICDVTLRELEDIKVSRIKDEDIKYAARNLTRLLASDKEQWEALRVSNGEGLSNDEKIVSCAFSLLVVNKFRGPHNITDGVFVTDDLCLENLARSKGLSVMTSAEILKQQAQEDSFTGFRIIRADDALMEHFHDDLTKNTSECNINEYVILHGEDKTRFVYRWTGEEYELIYGSALYSPEFGEVKPKDEYQRLAVDSIMNNMVTAISGPAGSGKSLLAMTCAFDLIRRGKYDRVVMLVNPARAKGAINTGYYPGTSEEKLLASFVGNMLCSKFGDMYAVERLLDADKLRLICMSDIRGMEISKEEILYIPECQNTTIELLKLCLSRVCDGAKVIIEGDYTTQVDSDVFAGNKNGMKRAVEVMKGSPLFGYVELQHVWRSQLGQLIARM